jgi:hypothetical protein
LVYWGFAQPNVRLVPIRISPGCIGKHALVRICDPVKNTHCGMVLLSKVTVPLKPIRAMFTGRLLVMPVPLYCAAASLLVAYEATPLVAVRVEHVIPAVELRPDIYVVPRLLKYDPLTESER